MEKKFTLLTHEDLELKKELLGHARSLKSKQGFENGLASGIIYSSFAEYLSENLLMNLRHLVYSGAYKFYAGIICMDERKLRPNKTLGANIGELEKFNFPDKNAILDCLRKIAEARNNIFHSFAKENMDGVVRLLTQDLKVIQEETEDLVDKIDTIYAGLKKIIDQSSSENPSDNQSNKETESTHPTTS